MDDNRFQMTCGNIELGILSKLGPCPGNPGHTFRPSCFWSSPVELFGVLQLNCSDPSPFRLSGQSSYFSGTTLFQAFSTNSGPTFPVQKNSL